jgi:hypothetical protein
MIDNKLISNNLSLGIAMEAFCPYHYPGALDF